MLKRQLAYLLVSNPSISDLEAFDRYRKEYDMPENPTLEESAETTLQETFKAVCFVVNGMSDNLLSVWRRRLNAELHLEQPLSDQWKPPTSSFFEGFSPGELALSDMIIMQNPKGYRKLEKLMELRNGQK